MAAVPAKKICAHNAISFDGTRERELASGKTVEVHVAAIDHDRCLGCGRCIGVCNQDAINPDYDAAADVLNCKIAEYTKAIVDGRPSFHISLAMDISPNCDCHAENDTPIVNDIGMFASFDPVAIDQACADAVLASEPLPNTVLTDSAAKMEHNHEHLKGEQAKDPSASRTPTPTGAPASRMPRRSAWARASMSSSRSNSA